ncbi:MAG UNVERIFIED_CONTAM: FCD domain-containing protein, partial [Thermobifida fusca]
IYTCRAAIEGMAAYLAARNVTGDDLRDLESIHLRLAEAHDRRDTRACVELNTRFHDQIISLARDPWLAKMYAMLRVHARQLGKNARSGLFWLDQPFVCPGGC